ncbi:MAG: response regulator [Burkholderiales bacterium]|nr:response regulator [Burkholderiales bacterium]
MDTNLTRKPRVLVVDDTPDNLFLMTALLEDTCDVVTAESGMEALAIASGSMPPDLILLDVMMPGMDGLAVMRRLRQQPATASIPVVFLTGNSRTEEVMEGLELGAADYLSKPIDPPLVLARVESLAVLH